MLGPLSCELTRWLVQSPRQLTAFISSSVCVNSLSVSDRQLALFTFWCEFQRESVGSDFFGLPASSCHGVSPSELHGVCGGGSLPLPSRFTFFMVLQW